MNEWAEQIFRTVSVLELLTVKRLDGTVDFSVVVVSEVTMINGAKVAYKKQKHIH